MEIWSLIQNELYAEAIAKAEYEYNNQKNIFFLRNKIYALLNLHNYDDCIKLSEKIINETRGDTDTDFILAGIAYWAIGKPEQSLKLWTDAQKCMFKDVSGGLEIQLFLLFYGYKSSNNELIKITRKKIKNIISNTRGSFWPGCMGKYILKLISKEELLGRIPKDEILRNRALCQLHFLFAIEQLGKKDIYNYKQQLLECINYGKYSKIEDAYYLAIAEL